MNTIPQITTVAELQRNYRPLINRIKKSSQPLFVLSNGKPDSVLIDINSFESREKRFQGLEEDNLLALVSEARKDSKQKKNILAKSNETLMDVLNRYAD